MKKDLTYYLNLDYPITIEKYTEYDGEEYFEAELPDLPGCSAHGKSIEEAIKNLEEAKKAWIEVSLKEGLDIPEPVSESDFSGRILLRVPPRLHGKLIRKAKESKMSLNQYIRSLLENNLSWEYFVKEIASLRQTVNQLTQNVFAIKENLVELYQSKINMTTSSESYSDDYYREAA